MANRFPLIIDSSELKVKELPSGDNLDLTGNDISAVRNILPEASDTYDLGSAGLRWKDIYLSGNSIFLDQLQISYANGIVTFFDNTNQLEFELTTDGTHTYEKLSVSEQTILSGNTIIDGSLIINGVDLQLFGSAEEPIEQFFGGDIVTENLTVSNTASIDTFFSNNTSIENATIVNDINIFDGASISVDGDKGLDGQYLTSTGNTVTWTNPPVAENVLYVSESGNDNNDGKTLGGAFRTIAAAANAASSNTTIFIKAGDYQEVTPIVLPERCALVGDSLRTVTVRSFDANSDLIHVRNACFVTGITFRDHTNGAAAIAFPDDGAGIITTSPYIQNCSSITTSGAGMRIDGLKADGLKSMVTDSYTQFNQGGIGIHITNGSYAQLVSIFTICCDDGILCSNGGFCSITNSNNSFGNRGLRADGLSSVIRTGTVAGAGQFGTQITIDGLSETPKVSEVIQFGSNSEFYTISSATTLDANTSTVTLRESISADESPDDAETVSFYERSLITASSHTFEFVGTGTNILTATPRLGGVPNQELEVVEENGGKVNYTSTDQWGDFRIGDGILIDNGQGVISGETFDRGLFAVLTPYILALET